MTNQNNTAHDLSTSSGGRAYIAEYFATQLRRHDFAKYINSTLAADFACALAQHLSKMRAEGVEAGATDAQEAFATWWNAQDEGSIQFDLEQYPQDLKATLNNLWNTAWRAGLASAPVAGEAVAIPLRPLTEDERAAIEFYILNPTAAVRDLDKRLSSHAAPQAREAVRILFPAHLRKMWSGGEVQAWLDNYQGVTPPIASAKGSLERYRNWRAEQAEADKDGVRSKGRQ
ncbi:hypothetical protein ACNPPY_04380 [Achromobacter sp. AGC78]